MGSMGIPSYDVIIVGGGFSGAWHLHHLRKAGFSVHLLEAGSALGGTWYWNCYPGARVDTQIPVYQFTDKITWDNWNWTERYPARDEIQEYFKYIDRSWDLSRDIEYNSSVTAMTWEDASNSWLIEVGSTNKIYRGQHVIMSTGFAAKPFTPPFRNLGKYQGVIQHTSRWPQDRSIELKDKKVAVIGTGATGVQVIQAASKVATHLTVFQRTPNMVVPMGQFDVDKVYNDKLRSQHAEIKDLIDSTYAGFVYDFVPKLGANVSDEEREELFERMFYAGGLQFWLGNYSDILENREVNAAAYQFWRKKALARIHDPELAKILAPEKPPHPFGAKRVSLEQGFFEAFNRPNVSLIDASKTGNPISEFTAKGIKTQDGVEHEFDVIILATGFDAITGSMTKIDIRGREGTIRKKWENGVYTYLGLSAHGFPNFFFVYGPQAPTAFSTGPACVEAQGPWIVQCLENLKSKGLKTIEPTEQAEIQWREHVNEEGNKNLVHEAESWYFGGNIPGKPKEALNYMAGLPEYRKRIWRSAEQGYAGFDLK